MKLKIKKLTETSQIPMQATSGAAGMDLYADLVGRGGELTLKTREGEPVHILMPPGGVVAVPTGLSMAIQKGYEGQIRPRSGLAAKQQITVANAPGTIDSDYRGEVKVLLYNMSREWREIKHGDRIAQLVISKIPNVVLSEVDELDDTERGSGGFGSTGS